MMSHNDISDGYHHISRKVQDIRIRSDKRIPLSIGNGSEERKTTLYLPQMVYRS